MKRLGLLVAGLLVWAAIPGSSLFASSLCTGTIQDLLSAGVCNFDVFSIQVLSFTATGSQANLLNASQIDLSATALTNDVGASVLLSPMEVPFQAGGAPAGTSVSADYHITYALIAPAAFLSEMLTVNNGTNSPLLGSYTVTKTVEGITDTVTDRLLQTRTVLLPGDASAIIVDDDILLNASTTNGTRITSPRAGSATIGSVKNQFSVAIPEPVSCVLCGSGLLAFGFLTNRRRRR